MKIIRRSGAWPHAECCGHPPRLPMGATRTTRPGSRHHFWRHRTVVRPDGRDGAQRAGGPVASACVNFDRSEGFSDITDIGGMFAFGVTDRVELFGTMGYRRIDADLVPGRAQRPAAGLPDQPGLDHGSRRPRRRREVQHPSRRRRTTATPSPCASLPKLPTASTDDGLGTGKLDFHVRPDRIARVHRRRWSSRLRSASRCAAAQRATT